MRGVLKKLSDMVGSEGNVGMPVWRDKAVSAVDLVEAEETGCFPFDSLKAAEAVEFAPKTMDTDKLNSRAKVVDSFIG